MIAVVGQGLMGVTDVRKRKDESINQTQLNCFELRQKSQNIYIYIYIYIYKKKKSFKNVTKVRC